MSALACIALGVLAAAVVAMLGTNDTADARETFATREEAAVYALIQDAAGYDCFISPRNGGWEVRCYLRRPGGEP